MKKKLSTAEKITLGIVIALAVAVIAVGATIIFSSNKSEGSAPAETAAKSSQSSTSGSKAESSGSESKKTASSKSSASKSSKSTKQKTSSASASSQTESKASSETSSKASAPKSSTSSKAESKTSGKTSSKTSSKQSKTSSKTAPEPSGKDVCVINGVKRSVGDIITVTMKLETPVEIENYQGFTDYDASYLKPGKITSSTGAGFVNDVGGTIKYNESRIGGMDFTGGDAVYTATFKVLRPGETNLDNTLQVACDTDSNKLDLSKCKVVFEIK